MNAADSQSTMNTIATVRECVRQAMQEARQGFAVDWDGLTMEVFRFQAVHNPIYSKYVRLRGIDLESVMNVSAIPFLPVEFFQNHDVRVSPTQWSPEKEFRSSGTTGSIPSVHGVDDLSWYHEVARRGFEWCLHDIKEAAFLALLPGYSERLDSSLVDMVVSFMECTEQTPTSSWFFLKNFQAMEAQLDVWAAEGCVKRIYLVGVTHALLEWAVTVAPAKADRWNALALHVVETGGMKGHGLERIRTEVQQALQPLTPKVPVHSEYGMTELLSQAWSVSSGRFWAPPWMRIQIGALDDPGQWLGIGEQGRIHIVDLANVASCAFIATGDIGRLHPDGSFEVLGRFDHAEVRGCNLMVIDW